MTINQIDPISDKDFRDKIKNSVQGILDAAFISGPKTIIRDMHGRLTFACPYCGDSEKEGKKKRGNLFWDTLQYHCYNAGCNVHKPLHLLLKDFNVDDINSEDKLAIIEYIKNNKLTIVRPKFIEFELFEKLKNLSVPLDVFYKITGTRPITKDSQGYKILKNRLLLHRLNHFSWKQNRLFILNLTADQKSVIGCQIRTISNNNSNKYFTFHLEKLRDLAGLSTLDKCENELELEKLNKLSTLFGILTVDFTKKVTSFEGPIDSMFMKNSIGQSSVGRDMSIFDDLPTVRYFYDNDKSGKEASIEQIKKGHEVFLWKKFISDHGLSEYINKGQKLKDLNDLIKMCYNNRLDSYRYIEKYFSNKIIDLYYI